MYAEVEMINREKMKFLGVLNMPKIFLQWKPGIIKPAAQILNLAIKSQANMHRFQRKANEAGQ